MSVRQMRKEQRE